MFTANKISSRRHSHAQYFVNLTTIGQGKTLQRMQFKVIFICFIILSAYLGWAFKFIARNYQIIAMSFLIFLSQYCVSK
jgi:hypothetical protein